jgi:hypothetical protein
MRIKKLPVPLFDGRGKRSVITRFVDGINRNRLEVQNGRIFGLAVIQAFLIDVCLSRAKDAAKTVDACI